jgi:hypothetical protein
MEDRPASDHKRFSKGTVVMASIIALLVVGAVVAVVLAFVSGDSGEAGGNGSGQETGQTIVEGTGPGPSGSASGSEQSGTGDAGSAQAANPLNEAAPPPLPAGETATHQGQARLTTVVSGQNFSVDVGITIKMDGADGFLFAYAGTGTVPVNMGPGVAVTADYAISGNFTGAVDGEAFTGTGPATVQATVTIPGMGPQRGGSTEQLVIRGTMRETEGGRLEGEFVGGSYSGTFWAEPV